MKTVNLHSHSSLPDHQIGWVNHSLPSAFHPGKNQMYSAGLHPWNLDEVTQGNWEEQLNAILQHPQVLAVGECGIDRTLETSVEQQLAFFLPQLKLAEKFHKPVILHAVRSYSDLLRLKKECQSRIPWILHGYQGNAETTRQLVRQGFFFSFGKTLLNDRKKLNQSLQEIPMSQLFFETDEHTETIESIYIFAGKLLHIGEEVLKKQVFENYQQLFEK